jgi:hypothetical protein
MQATLESPAGCDKNVYVTFPDEAEEGPPHMMSLCPSNSRGKYSEIEAEASNAAPSMASGGYCRNLRYLIPPRQSNPEVQVAIWKC